MCIVLRTLFTANIPTHIARETPKNPNVTLPVSVVRRLHHFRMLMEDSSNSFVSFRPLPKWQFCRVASVCTAVPLRSVCSKDAAGHSHSPTPKSGVELYTVGSCEKLILGSLRNPGRFKKSFDPTL